MSKERVKDGERMRVSPKLDGVYARATKEGVFSRSGNRLDLPKVEKRLRRHFRKNPDGELAGELWRKGDGIERIAGAARAGGDAAKRLRLHTFPDQGKRPWPIGAVRRVNAKTARTPEQVGRLYRKALKKGHEGVMIRRPDGTVEKRKPRQDAEYVAARGSEGKRGVLVTKDGFKVQARAGLVVKPGQRVQVSYSGMTRKGVPKAAVAERVRETQDFETQDTREDFMKEFKMKAEMTDAERAQVKKDRRALVRGAVIAAGGVGALALIARKSRGGAVGLEPWVPPVAKAKPVAGAQGAIANATRKYGDATAQERLVKAGQIRRKRAWGAVSPKRPFGKNAAKLKPEEAARAVALRGAGAKGAPVALPKKVNVGQLSPGERKAVPRFEREKRRQAREVLQAMREKRRFETQDGGLKSFDMWAISRKKREDEEKKRRAGQMKSLRYSGMLTERAADGQMKGFDTPAMGMLTFEKRDRTTGQKLKDAAVGGGALASGGAAVYGAHQWGKTNRKLRQVADVASGEIVKTGRSVRAASGVAGRAAAKAGNAVKQVGETLSPQAVAQAGIKEVKRAAKAGVKKMKLWETPASAVIDFAGQQQWRDVQDDTFADPLRVAAGMQRGYYSKEGKDKGGDAAPVMHGQVIRAARNKAKKINTVARRGGGLVKDTVDTVRGKPRERDAAGRVKKKEWEKSWFKNKVGELATAGAILGGTAYVSKNPRARGAVRRGEKWVVKQARRVNPDVFPKGRVLETQDGKTQDARLKMFATPAGKLLGKFKGPDKAAVARLAERQALLSRLKAKNGAKAAQVAKRVAQDVRMKGDVVNAAVRRRKDAVRGLKRGAAVAGTGALVGGTAMKLHADQPEKSKVNQGARFRNALIGSGAGAMMGSYLAGGKSGYRGSRIGALAGGVIGAVSNPKRKRVIEELPVASFEAGVRGQESGVRGQMKMFMGYPEAAIVGGLAAGTGYGIYRGAKALKNKLSKAKKKDGGKQFATPAGGVIEFARGDRYVKMRKEDLLNAGRVPRVRVPKRNSPQAMGAAARLKMERAGNKSIDKWLRTVVPGSGNRPDLAASHRPAWSIFETPAMRLLNFDWAAEDAGWDVRDPRGRSARVFAPGSQKRERREKRWHEKAENERKLWKAAVIAAGVSGLAGGAAMRGKSGKKGKAPSLAPAAAPTGGYHYRGPRSTVRPGARVERPQFRR